MLGQRRTFGNLATFFPGARHGGSIRVDGQSARGNSLSWNDIAWLRDRWPGKLVLKGVLDAADAREAVAAGVDGLIVSNHGGRQLDAATSTLSARSRIVEAAAGRGEVLLDGGVHGADVLKSLALGARGGLIGRSYLYGLAALGERGVSLALQILRRELEISMALTGTTDARNVARRILVDES